MPTYEYRCCECDHRFERFQKMSDDPVRVCEVCGSTVERVLFPVAVHFKGSGFYTTDYGKKKTLKSGSGNGAESDSKNGSESNAESDSSASSSKADEKPSSSGSKDKVSSGS